MQDQDDSLADNIDLYLDELQRLPYPTEAITALNVPWEERPSYIMGFFRDKCSQDHITSKCSFSVEQLPELLEEHHNPDLPRFIKVLLVDTANLTPACVEILGIYLNIPPVFFAAHVATGGTEADPECGYLDVLRQVTNISEPCLTPYATLDSRYTANVPP